MMFEWSFQIFFYIVVSSWVLLCHGLVAKVSQQEVFINGQNLFKY